MWRRVLNFSVCGLVIMYRVKSENTIKAHVVNYCY